MAPDCQDKNLQGITMVAVGMNKAAEEYFILDERTRAELASGKYRDQRRGLFGPPAAPAGRGAESGRQSSVGSARSRPRAGRQRGQPEARIQPAKPRWTRSQEKLALLYNEQGLRPVEIAEKLGISSHQVTQIILAAKNRGKA
jgi:hypothetical protein